MNTDFSATPLAALGTHVTDPLNELIAALGETGLAPELLEMCAARIEHLVSGGEVSTPPQPQDQRSQALIGFVEQYVLDAHGVTDQMCAELSSHFSPPELAALTTAIATFEALARSRAVLKGVIR